MKLSIVIPAYNEEKRIGKTLFQYSAFFKKVKKSSSLAYEILVVINNTKDKTEDEVKKAQKNDKNIKYINLKKGGKGYAVIEGFKISLQKDFDLIGFVDADLATPANEFYRLVKEINSYDGAIANRHLKQSVIYPHTSFRNYLVSKSFNLFARFLFMFEFTDTQCGAKLFKRNALEKILPELSMSSWAFDVNLLFVSKNHHLKIKQVPTTWYEQKGSSIKIGRTSIGMFLALLRLRVIRSPFKRVLKPLKPIVDFAWRRL